MGMFDIVEYTAKCKKCGAELEDGFQSKSGDCVLAHVEPKDVSDFYGWCFACKSMNYFKVNRTITVDSIDQMIDEN